MPIFNRTDKSVSRSFPKSKKVHGITIEKAPIGKYLTAARGLENLPAEILGSLFPDKQPGEILTYLTKITSDEVSSLLVTGAVDLVDHLIRLMAPILNVSEETLLELSPTEFTDVMTAFKEINDLSRFFTTVSGMFKKMIPPTPTDGFKAG